MSVYQLGKKDFVPKSSDFKWAEFRLTIKRQLDQIVMPKTFGHGNTYADWQMLANGPDPTAPGRAKHGAGCCEVSAAANETKIAITDAGGAPGPTSALFDGTTTITDYTAIGKASGQPGYDPKTGTGDEGLETRARLDYQQKVGLLDTQGNRRKIGQFVLLDPGNLQHVLEALLFFEALPIGVQLQQAQMDQFNEGEAANQTIVWDYVSGSPTLGGHCVPECGRPDQNHIAAISWRRRIFLTSTFLANQCDEVWAYLTPERISRVTGKTYEGADPAHLEEYLHTVSSKLVR